MKNIYETYNPYNVLIIKAPDLTEQLYSRFTSSS